MDGRSMKRLLQTKGRVAERAHARSKPAVTGRNAKRRAGARAAILAAAGRIFASSGLEGARTDAIARSAGVNKAMLYYYFRSKDLLYLAVLEEHFMEFHRMAMEVLGQKSSAGELVLRFVETHFDFIGSRPEYPRLFQYVMMADAQRGMRLLRKYLMPVSAKLVEVLERGKRAREFLPLDSNHAAISMVALNVFYFSTAPVVKMVTGIDPYSAASRRRRKEEVLRFVRYGIFRHPEAAR
jgi:TetR/AcrR family transcriptional regulator